MECYRLAKHLSGAAVAELFARHGLFGYIAELFARHGLFGYIMRYFESLHVNGDKYLVEDFDDYIAHHAV